MTFTSPTTGWLAGAPCSAIGVSFYRTVDGARRWHKVSLPGLGIPVCQGGQCYLSPPAFFGRIGVVVVAGSARPVVYGSRDAGATWTPYATPHVRLRGAVFVNPSDGWAPAGNGQSIYQSMDGELSWSKLPVWVRSAGPTVAAGIGQQGVAFGGNGGQGATGLLAQVLGANGAVLESSGSGSPLVPPSRLAGLTTETFLQAKVTGVADVARILVLPQAEDGRRVWVVVAISLASRSEALSRLLLLMLVGGPVALAMASLAGWAVAGAAFARSSACGNRPRRSRSTVAAGAFPCRPRRGLRSRIRRRPASACLRAVRTGSRRTGRGQERARGSASPSSRRSRRHTAGG